MKHVSKLLLCLLIGIVSYICVHSLTMTSNPSPAADNHKQKKQEMQPRRDHKLEKQCHEVVALIKKEEKRTKTKHREKCIERLLEESFLQLQSSGGQPIDLLSGFDQLATLLRELKGKDLSIFFKGSVVRDQVRVLTNLLERIVENGPFVKKLKKEETTGDNLSYIYPFLNHYLLLLAHASKLTSLFAQALSRAQEKAVTNRASRLNQTMIALLLDLRHISTTLIGLRDSLKAFHGPIRSLSA